MTTGARPPTPQRGCSIPTNIGASPNDGWVQYFWAEQTVSREEYPRQFGQRLRMQNRTYFNHRIDMWTDDGENIVEHLAGVEDFTVAIIDAAAPQALAGCRRQPCGRARG